MDQLLLFFHFFGLVLGVGPGISQLAVTAATASMAQPGPEIFRLRSVLRTMTGIGIGLLWITGLAMVWVRYGGFGGMPGAFWIKLLFVVALTAVHAFMHIDARRPPTHPAGAARARILGALSGVLALAAMLFAVIAFN